MTVNRQQKNRGSEQGIPYPQQEDTRRRQEGSQGGDSPQNHRETGDKRRIEGSLSPQAGQPALTGAEVDPQELDEEDEDRKVQRFDRESQGEDSPNRGGKGAGQMQEEAGPDPAEAERQKKEMLGGGSGADRSRK